MYSECKSDILCQTTVRSVGEGGGGGVRDGHLWACKLIAALGSWPLADLIGLSETKGKVLTLIFSFLFLDWVENINCMMTDKRKIPNHNSWLNSAIHSCWILDSSHWVTKRPQWRKAVSKKEKKKNLQVVLVKSFQWVGRRESPRKINTRRPLGVSIRTRPSWTCCSSGWCCRPCARSWAWWTPSGWRAPRLASRWGNHAGGGARRTPGFRRYGPKAAPSGPGHPGSGRQSRTEERTMIRGLRDVITWLLHTHMYHTLSLGTTEKQIINIHM